MKITLKRAAIVAAIIFMTTVGSFALNFIQTYYTATQGNHPVTIANSVTIAKSQSIQVGASLRAAAKYDINFGNCTIMPEGTPRYGFVAQNFPFTIYVTVTNTGDLPVHLDTITMNSNNSSIGGNIIAVSAPIASIPPNYADVFYLNVNPATWPLAWVKFTFIASANNNAVSAGSTLVLGVVPPINLNSTTTTTSSTTTSSNTSFTGTVCHFTFQG